VRALALERFVDGNYPGSEVEVVNSNRASFTRGGCPSSWLEKPPLCDRNFGYRRRAVAKGLYKVWGQFKHNGFIQTFPFVVNL
jgi:hypothetical protein